MSMHGPGIRPAGSDGPMYALGRDFAHVLPAMIASASRAIENEYWPELYPICEVVYQQSPTERNDFLEELKHVRDCYCLFLEHSCDDPLESVEDVFEKVGWNECHAAARLLWAAMLGAVVSGQVFAGLRDITPLGGPMPPHVDVALREMREGARRAFNNAGRVEDLIRNLKDTIKMCRNADVSYEEIQSVVSDVKTGR